LPELQTLKNQQLAGVALGMGSFSKYNQEDLLHYTHPLITGVFLVTLAELPHPTTE